MPSYRLTPTGPSMAADGFALFRDAYLRARRANSLLPALTQDHEARLRRRVERAFAHGGVARERLRDLSDVVVADAARGEHEAWLARVERVPHATPWDALAPLAAEHAAYYRESPLFVVKDASLEAAVADLEAHRAADDAAFVVRDGDAWLAYLIVGRCPAVTEGRLLGETATAQVRSAFVVPAARRGGIGGALLQQAVAWTRDAGFERLFVEHETANLPGAAFWRRHFEPYLVFSMRYVDRMA